MIPPVFIAPRLAPLLLACCLAPLVLRAQQPVTTRPAYPTLLNPALAVPAGSPVADGAKLPPIPLPPPPATLPAPVAGVATPLLPLAAVSAVPIVNPGQWPAAFGGIDPLRRAAATPALGIQLAGPTAPLGGAPTTSARADGVFPTMALALGPDGSAPALLLTLSFPAAQAGKRLWVHPIDGGQCNGLPGARAVDVGPGGLTPIAFQPPAATGLYRLSLRLDGVESVLPLRVVRPGDLTDPRLPAEIVVGPGSVLPATN